MHVIHIWTVYPRIRFDSPNHCTVNKTQVNIYRLSSNLFGNAGNFQYLIFFVFPHTQKVTSQGYKTSQLKIFNLTMLHQILMSTQVIWAHSEKYIVN